MSGSRSLSTGVAAAIAAPVYRDVYFLSMAFDEGTERACTAPFSIWFDDEGTGIPNEFLGVGLLGRISAIEESSELRSYGITASLSGVDPAQAAIVLSTRCQGRPATVNLGFLDAGHVLIADPTPVFPGEMDTMTLSIGSSAEISLAIENPLSRWENPNPANQRYTDADQQRVYPGDRFYQWASNTVARELIWGRT